MSNGRGIVKLMFVLAALAITLNSFGQNLALNQTYTVSKNSNYPAVSADSTHKVLTDGQYTSGQFWNSKTTTGWQFTLKVYITIPLGGINNIDKITFNTARGNWAGVNYPAHVYAFTSTDNINYSYQGDVVAGSDNKPGTYAIHKFELSNIRQKAAYVKLAVIPNGSYIFCDEIEVIKGNNSNNNKPLVAAAEIDSKVNSMISKSAYIGKLQSDANFAPQTNIDELLNTSVQKWASVQRKSFNSDILISKISPWEKVSLPFVPKPSSNLTYQANVATNGSQYLAFVLSNLSQARRVFNFSTSFNGNARVDLYNTGYVLTGKDLDQIADPIIKINDTLGLNSGESKVIFLKVAGIKQGISINNVKVSTNGYNAAIRITTNVSGVALESQSGLNAVNWAYLTFPMLSDRRETAVADLKAHGVNTMVVPANVIPYVVNNNFSLYQDYLKQLTGFKNLLIYINFPNKNNFKGTQFMSAEWKDKFLNWYKALVQNSAVANFNESQIYIYPYDEVAEKDTDDFYNFLSWIKAEHPSIKIYATLNTVAKWQKLGPLVSLIQIRNTAPMLAAVKGSDKNVWMYDISPFAESLSPYTYYRLMAWKAFANGIKGIGFWNYADYRNNMGNKATLGNFNGSQNTNYSVIYQGPGTSIISSRRWEAFSLGLKDYQLLEKYAAKVGVAAAIKLASTVVDNADDDSKADQACAQILLALKR